MKNLNIDENIITKVKPIEPAVQQAIIVDVSNSSKYPRTWSEEEVGIWFKNTKINVSITESLSPCDGRLLEQLYGTLIRVPEFFHSILHSDSNACLKDIVYFTAALAELFEKE